MKIIFTSCTRYEAFPIQSEWNDIAAQNPDYLFLLGDNIYMDYGIPFLSDEPVGSPKKYCPEEFEEIMEMKYYNQFNRVPPFKALVDEMRAKNGFFAIWDDHDFAWNDAKGADVKEEIKNISRKLFHKYTACSTNMPHVYYHTDTPLARVIFIDNRTDAEEENKCSKIISEEQFAFIESKLEHNLPYTILCGGITLTKGAENWTKYPDQLQRLCQLLEAKENVIFLAGDIHRNKFIPPKKIKKLGITTPVQLISSGMQINYLGLPIPLDDKHNWGMLEIEENKIKVSFFNKHAYQKKISGKANCWMNKNFLKNSIN